MLLEMDILFEVTDPRGRRIRLYRDRWQDHIIPPTHHPEMARHLTEVRSALKDPDCIQQSRQRGDTQLYYKLGVAKGRYKRLHIVVVARFPSKIRGYVRTAYLTPLPRGGDTIWIKPRR